MAIVQFPPHEAADEHGLLAVGGDLEPESLLLAYQSGIFPWPLIEGELLWFSPPKRALLFLNSFHVPKSLRKRMRRDEEVEIRINSCFSGVIESCASSPNRKGQDGTWIVPDMVRAYTELHRCGYCHSIECFRGSSLIGGLYGVAIKGMFAGESMFYKEPDASKRCLCFLVQYLQKRGVEWIDCQQLTPIFEDFGAVEVSRQRFLKLLEEALERDIALF